MNISQLLLLVIIISCCKDDKQSNVRTNVNGEIISLPFHWKIPIHEDGNGTNYNSSFNNNMVFGDKVLIPRTINAESRKITMIDSKDGSIIWDWSDWYQPKTETAYFRRRIVDNDYLHWVTGTRRYTIDIKSGTSILRHRNNDDISFFSRVSSNNSNSYLLSRIINNLGYSTTAIFECDINSENYMELLTMPYSIDSIGEENRIRGADDIIFYEQSGIGYLIIKSSQPYKDWYYDQRVNLYNLTEGIWEYTDKLATEPKQNNGGWMEIYDNKLYFTAGKEMFCYEIMTGEQLWKRAFPHDFTFSGFEIENDILVANCENQKAYGVDANFGNLIWQSEGSGTSSQLNNRIMDGVVYFSGGSPAFLYAKDIYTGETLWKLDPYLFESSNAFWSNNLNLIPGKNGEKGKVVVVSGTHAYCFEAAK